MFPKRQLIILFLAFFFAIIILLFVYFFWQPDSLIKFVPKKSSFYFHLDLNPVRRAGSLGNQWLNGKKAENLVKEIFKNNPNLVLSENIFKNRDILDEVGLIGISPNQDYFQRDKPPFKIDLVFLLKIKRWANSSLLFKPEKNFYVKKLNKRIWEVSLQEILSRENDAANNQTFLSRERVSLSNTISPAWAGGYVDFKNIIKKEGKENVFLENNPIEIKIYSSKTNSGDLLFGLKSLGQKSKAINFLTQDILEKDLKEGFVLINSKNESIDEFEKRIRIGLSFRRPAEENVSLPDGTEFTELKINPDKLEFQKEEINNTELRYWKDEFSKEQKPLEIFIWENQKYFYVSNKSSLFEAAKETSDSFVQNQILKGIYFSLNDKGIKDLTIIETTGGIKGILRLF